MLGGYDKLKCLEKIGQLRSGEDFTVIHFNEQCFIFLALVLQKQSPEIFFERVEIRRVLRLVESKNDLLSRIMSMYFRKPFYSYFFVIYNVSINFTEPLLRGGGGAPELFMHSVLK